RRTSATAPATVAPTAAAITQDRFLRAGCGDLARARGRPTSFGAATASVSSAKSDVFTFTGTLQGTLRISPVSSPVVLPLPAPPRPGGGGGGRGLFACGNAAALLNGSNASTTSSGAW